MCLFRRPFPGYKPVVAQFVVVISIFHMFISANRVGCVPFSRRTLRYLCINEICISLRMIKASGSFCVNVVFPTGPLCFLRRVSLLFPRRLKNFPMFPISVVLRFLFNRFSFPIFPMLVSLFLCRFLSKVWRIVNCQISNKTVKICGPFRMETVNVRRLMIRVKRRGIQMRRNLTRFLLGLRTTCSQCNKQRGIKVSNRTAIIIR